jgi:hypothetical protein
LLKAEYLFSPYNPAKAILTGDDLTISGNPGVGGLAGHVHTNGDLDVSGNPIVSGDLTASGTYAASGSPVVGGDFGGNRPLEAIPAIEPRDLYDQLSTQYAAAWFDLCPDGTIRRPGFGTPCTGIILANTSSGTAAFGWKISGNGLGVKWQNEPPFSNGVFYVYRAKAEISSNPGAPGSPWQATVVTEGQPNASACTQDYGDLEVSGNPVMTGYIPSLVFVAGRDLKINGNPSQQFTGFFAAREQIEISGNPTLVGAMVAEDRCDTGGSPVHFDSISGNMNLTFDGNIEIPVESLIRTTLWLEL